MARSLNKVQLIGNLTRDPEMRYTPQGTAVCTFGLATNRQWVTESGEKKEEADFHRVVAWNKLAEICAQLLRKGRKVYVEGRLSTRNWTGQDGAQRTTTEVVITDMIVLDRRQDIPEEIEIPETSLTAEPATTIEEVPPAAPSTPAATAAVSDDSKKKKKKLQDKEEPEEEDIPF